MTAKVIPLHGPRIAQSAAQVPAQKQDYITDVFGPDGYLAKKIPGYEQRDGQVQL